MLDVNRLRVFRAVVANGSVQAAATHLGYTPSTISQHITALQRETGLTLFEKSGRGIAPTAVGELLAAESDEVMTNLARLTGMVDDLRAGRTGRLEIASFASVAQAWVPGVVKRLHEEFPGIVVDLSLNEVFEQPAVPTADLDVRTEAVFEPPTEVAGYRRLELAEEDYVVVVPASHPLAGAGAVSLPELAEEAWVRDDRIESKCLRIINHACTSAGVSPRFVARADDHHTAMAFVAAGVGVTVLPRLASRTAPTGTAVLDLLDPTPRRRIVVFLRDAAETNRAAVRALGLLREAARGA